MDIKEALSHLGILVDEHTCQDCKEALVSIRIELERVSTTTGPNGPYGSPTRAHEIALSGSAEATAPNKSQPDTDTPKCIACKHVTNCRRWKVDKSCFEPIITA